MLIHSFGPWHKFECWECQLNRSSGQNDICNNIYFFFFSCHWLKSTVKVDRSLSLVQIFCKVTHFIFSQVIIQSQDMYMPRSASDWPCGQLEIWLSIATYVCSRTVRGAFLLIQKASGRYHRAWQHKLAEIWLDKKKKEPIGCNVTSREQTMDSNFIYIFTKKILEYYYEYI